MLRQRLQEPKSVLTTHQNEAQDQIKPSHLHRVFDPEFSSDFAAAGEAEAQQHRTARMRVVRLSNQSARSVQPRI